MKKIIFSVLVLIIFTGCGIWVFSHETEKSFEIKLTSEEKIKVDMLLQNMKTRCIGRYLVDLPESYISSEQDIITVNNNEITTKRIYLPAFEQRISLREQELLAAKTIDIQNMPYLKKIYPLPNGMKGMIFERVKNEAIRDASRVLEAHLYSNGVAIKIELAAMNGLDKRYDEYRKESPDVYRNQVPEKLSELNELLVRIQGRAEDEIPIIPGNCIQNAFIMDNRKDKESIDALYESNNSSQLRLSVSTNNFLQEKDSLLERSENIEKYLRSDNGHLLRKGSRKINELYTEELLAIGSYSSENKNKRYDFILLTNEKTGGIKSPVFSLELLNDELTPSPYNQNEIVNFWDAISQTLRVRPGAFSHE
ncbi:Uncharacterised protein [Yersinia frederiksenii]|nr:Uncharacterised protein [Yersinia frederiksenii]CNI24254.1 Uncharacterised protein [Yersinia frederiksenii]